jgi:uncharacterized protein (UPF0261 family)
VSRPCILIVGTADTKADEIRFLRRCVEGAGAGAMVMDVGVLGGAPFVPEVSGEQVAGAAGTTLEQVRASADENEAMATMARGAATLAAELQAKGRVDGAVILGGTMGTDLSLDVAAALPLGVPKIVVSTVAHSHLIPPDRIAPDLMTILWAGGLYGLNPVCESALSQAAGAVVGACRTAVAPRFDRPLVGMTSFGSSALKYMLRLKPALAERGFDLAVFHATGMGGRAFEALAAQGRFAAVMDFCLQEVSNHVHGSVVTSGPDRLSGAGLAGVPQLVAPGGIDMIDLPAWKPLPAGFEGRAYHAHNRLIASVGATADERRATARQVAAQLARATGPTAAILPLQGIEEWDRPGAPMHDPVARDAFFDEFRRRVPGGVRVVEIDAHINDDAFSDCALRLFDQWLADGVVARPKAGARP